jgi:cation transporter-like permease
MYTDAAAVDAATATNGHRSRRASAAGPTSSSTSATASSARRSGWLSAAPKDPTTWNTARASAVSQMPGRAVVRIASTVRPVPRPVVLPRA